MAAVVAHPGYGAYGDVRNRDIFHRHNYQVAKAASTSEPASLAHNYYAIAADGTTITGLPDSKQFELAKFNTTQAGDTRVGRLDISVNAGTGTAADKVVSSLTALEAKFSAPTVISELDTGYSSTLVKEGTTTKQTFAAGAGTTSITGGADSKLLLTAGVTSTSADATIRGNRLNWWQDGTATKKDSKAFTYTYAHNGGGDGVSTGTASFHLDNMNSTDVERMGDGKFEFNTYNSVGGVEQILTLGAKATAGQQPVQFSNSIVGIGATPDPLYKLAVGGATSFVGDSKVTGSMEITQDLQVLGNINVTGTVNTVNTTTINVDDKLIKLGGVGGTTEAPLTMTSADLDGAGLVVGGLDASGADSLAKFQYNHANTSWTSNIDIDLISGNAYEIAGGAQTSTTGTEGTGVTLDESGLYYGSSLAKLSMGVYEATTTPDVLLSKDGLAFGDENATIKFGTVATLDKNGISATSDAFALYFGAAKQWRIVMEKVSDGAGGFIDFLSMQHSINPADPEVTPYETKMSISP